MGYYLQRLKNVYHLLVAIASVIYYRYPASKLTVIGVTGTDGKTTTSTLIYHCLKQANYKVALISTVAAFVGNERIETGFHVTSPNSPSIQRLLAHIVKKGYSHLVLEATSHGLDQHRLFGTNIKIAVVTNITHEHLDYHQTFDKYVAAKAKIFINADSAIINADDQSFRQLKTFIPLQCQMISYSLKEQENFIAGFSRKEHAQIINQAKSTFHENYNQANALAAAIASRIIGIPVEKITHAIASFPGVPGRMQIIPNTKGITAIVDFAHTPNALSKALTAARKNTDGQLIVVFGAAGQRDHTKRAPMGEIAARLANEVILTAEDPRGESVLNINAQIISGAKQNRGHLHSIADRKSAIKFALSLAKKGDTLILCGKGHEQTMNLDGTHELPWSDVEVLTTLLNTHHS